MKFSSRLDCYRKKLRGECQAPEFRRAAEEKAQYVYTEHHPNITLLKITPQPKLTRNPSLLLRKIERRFLSVQEDSKEKKEEKTSRSLPIPLLSTVSAPISMSSTASAPHHVKIRSVFQLPIALSRFRLNRSNERINGKDPSPPLHFSPAPTPLLTPKTEPLPRSEKMLFNGLPTSSPRLIRHFLFNSDAPTRRTSVTFDVDKPPKEQQRKRSAPELGLRTGPRRSFASLYKQLATIRETH